MYSPVWISVFKYYNMVPWQSPFKVLIKETPPNNKFGCYRMQGTEPFPITLYIFLMQGSGNVQRNFFHSDTVTCHKHVIKFSFLHIFGFPVRPLYNLILWANQNVPLTQSLMVLIYGRFTCGSHNVFWSIGGSSSSLLQES